jgi:TolA-binding protein
VDLEVHGDATRVLATRGEIALDARGERRALRAGEAVDLRPPPPKPAPVAAVPPVERPDDGEIFRAGRAALRRGDRAAAEEAFDRVVRLSSNPRLRARATFALAELGLARGAKDDAEVRLAGLLRDPDPELAEDAALLLTAHARALVDAGDADAARAIARTLRAAPSLSDAARRELERVEAGMRR